VPTRRVTWTIRALVVPLLAGFVCGCGETSQQTATPAASTPTTVPTKASGPAESPAASATAGQGVVTISYSDGQVTSSAGDRLQVAVGETVRLEVASDTAEEVHVHGYDLSADVAPGQAASLAFTADIPGIFEVELEKSHTPLLSLEVH
jgi:heme/copper-type cytochrome/quinol oxidase subunit 2